MVGSDASTKIPMQGWAKTSEEVRLALSCWEDEEGPIANLLVILFRIIFLIVGANGCSPEEWKPSHRRKAPKSIGGRKARFAGKQRIGLERSGYEERVRKYGLLGAGYRVRVRKIG